MNNLVCCPVDNTLKIIGKKFTVHILRNMMMQNQTRFNEFLESIENINPKTLSVRLREMEKNGLIDRIVHTDTSPIRVKYSLTEKGTKIRSILEQMAAFSMAYCSDQVFKDKTPRMLKEAIRIKPSILR